MGRIRTFRASFAITAGSFVLWMVGTSWPWLVYTAAGFGALLGPPMAGVLIDATGATPTERA